MRFGCITYHNVDEKVPLAVIATGDLVQVVLIIIHALATMAGFVGQVVHLAIGVAHHVALPIGGLGDPVGQVHFKGGRAGPVGHLDQNAHFVVLISDLLPSL